MAPERPLLRVLSMLALHVVVSGEVSGEEDVAFVKLLDKNADGRLSLGELSEVQVGDRRLTNSDKAVLEKHFASADGDRDGSLNRNEFREFLDMEMGSGDITQVGDAEHASVMRRFDNDGDGKLSMAEFRKIDGMSEPAHPADIALLEKQFRSADVDSDGLISTGELPKLLEAESNVKAASVLKHVDVDKDGRVSLHEFIYSLAESKSEDEQNIFQRVFKKSDKDSNGFIQLDEIPMLMQAIDDESEA